MPKITRKRGGDLVICNLQNTPLDNIATLRIYEKCDVVMNEVMKRLKIPTLDWELKRKLVVKAKRTAKEVNVELDGIECGTKNQRIPASILKEVVMDWGNMGKKESKTKEPFAFKTSKVTKEGLKTKVTLKFMGNYNEPDLVLSIDVNDEELEKVYTLKFNPKTRKWNVKEKKDNQKEEEKEEKMETNNDSENDNDNDSEED